MPDIWTIREALEWTIAYLDKKGDANPRLSAQWLMSFATRLERLGIYANYDKPLSLEERSVLRDAVSRRALHEPLQYITGEVGFRYLTLKVAKNVLIPRPETEVLVSEALKCLPKPSKLEQADSEQELPSASLLVADICTGSACIACSIAKEHPDTFVYATDISPDAIALARENVDALELNDRVAVLEGNLGSPIPEDLLGLFDVVVSNPPYIPHGLLEELDHEVKDFEPMLALDGGNDGLDLFRELLLWAKMALKNNGALCVELHEESLCDARELALAAGFSKVTVVEDLAHRPRVLVARHVL